MATRVGTSRDAADRLRGAWRWPLAFSWRPRQRRRSHGTWWSTWASSPDAPAGTSEGWSINAAGTVAGSSSYNPANLPAFRGVVANDQGMTALAQPLAGGLSRAHEINDSGQVAGWDRAPGATDRRLPVLWTGGIPTILNTLPQHANALALSLNTQGVAVGQSAPAPTGGNGSRAVVWNGLTPTDLGTLGGQQSLAQGINDAGQIVGFSFLADGSLRATLWENGSIVNLGSGGNFSYATAINNKGQIVGSSTGPFNPRAYLWDHGTMTNIDPRGTGGDSIAFDINELGSIVGEYRNSAGVPPGIPLVPRAVLRSHGPAASLEPGMDGADGSRHQRRRTDHGTRVPDRHRMPGGSPGPRVHAVSGRRRHQQLLRHADRAAQPGRYRDHGDDDVPAERRRRRQSCTPCRCRRGPEPR